VAKQVQKEYNCNNDMMAVYLTEVHRIEKFFDGFEVRMPHVWTTVMLIIWPGLLPPRHRPHRMLLLRDYQSIP
jgi:hypothetical protein